MQSEKIEINLDLEPRIGREYSDVDHETYDVVKGNTVYI